MLIESGAGWEARLLPYPFRFSWLCFTFEAHD
jgi:hypothetical protein